MMKVLLINGSPDRSGNTYLALSEIAGILSDEGVDSDILWIGKKAVQGCVACHACSSGGACAFRDELYRTARQKIIECDGIIIGSPVFFAGPNGSLCALLDRLFMSCREYLAYKPAASVSVCRRSGSTATFDRLNKYFMMNNMPVVSSQYWNNVHGNKVGEVCGDIEGMQTMRTLAHNMAWLLRAVRPFSHPEGEPVAYTDFIR